MPIETDDKNQSLFDVVPPAARLADTVTQSIADALLEGRIAPGEALPSEGEIARTFGVSKPIAREALRQLAGVGLIHTQQGKVARAKALNGRAARAVLRFRRAFQPHASAGGKRDAPGRGDRDRSAGCPAAQ